MRIEFKGLIAALIAALTVLGGAFGIAAIVTARDGGKAATSASASQMNRSMGRMSGKMKAMDAKMGGPQLVAAGRSLFTQSCSSCHGANAKGMAGDGPSLYGLGLPATKITAVIRNGIPPRMPAFGKRYNGQKIQALVAYIQSLKK